MTTTIPDYKGFNGNQLQQFMKNCYKNWEWWTILCHSNCTEREQFCVWKLNWSLFCFRNIKKLGSSLCFVNGEKLSKYQSFRCKQSHNHLQPVLAWVKRHQFKLFESQFKVQVQDEADNQARKTKGVGQNNFPDWIWKLNGRFHLFWSCFRNNFDCKIIWIHLAQCSGSSRLLQCANKPRFYGLLQVCLLVLFTVSGSIKYWLFGRFRGIDSISLNTDRICIFFS